ncbi:hypothetical protein ACFPYJ_14315 [Paenibacillus solisilvae]|uniref:Uncharacterized protein n=1 Tax=Paenibacillus solisilvae TaxID=2486751 RepID=A0ABW0VZ26_9BACL
MLKILRNKLVVGVLAVTFIVAVSVSSPSKADAMFCESIPPCSDMYDCVHVAYWYYFLR